VGFSPAVITKDAPPTGAASAAVERSAQRTAESCAGIRMTLDDDGIVGLA